MSQQFDRHRTDTRSIADIFNEHMLLENERELARADFGVDFEASGTIADRMTRLNTALAKALRHMGLDPFLVLTAVAPSIVGKDHFGEEVIRGAIAFPTWTSDVDSNKSRGRHMYPQADVEPHFKTDHFAWLATILREGAPISHGEQATPTGVLAITYYIRAPSAISTHIPFDPEKAILCAIEECGSVTDPSWDKLTEAASGASWSQQIVFMIAAKSIDIERTIERIKKAKTEFFDSLGAWLSASGLSAEEAPILRAQRIAAHAILFSHEAANAVRFIPELAQVVTRLGECNEQSHYEELAHQLSRLMPRLRSLNELVSGVENAKRAAMDLVPFGVRNELFKWLETWRANTIDGAPASSATAWEFSIEAVKVKAYLDLPQDTPRICFSPLYFQQILVQLTRNAVDHWKSHGTSEREIRITFRPKNGSRWQMTFGNTVSIAVEEAIRQRLFRQIAHPDSNTNRGTALWGIGMALFGLYVGA